MTQAKFHVLWDVKRKRPKLYADFLSNPYFHGTIEVLECPTNPAHCGKRFTYKGEIDTVTPYFYLHGALKFGKQNTCEPAQRHPRFQLQFKYESSDSVPTEVFRFVYQERTPTKDFNIQQLWNRIQQDLSKARYMLSHDYKQIAMADLVETEFFNNDMRSYSAWTRAPLEQPLIWYFGRNGHRYVVGDKLLQVRELEYDKLVRAYNWLRMVPFKFCIPHYCKEFGFKPISFAQYLAVQKDFGRSPQQAPMVTAAMAMYSFVQHRRRQGHTLYRQDVIVGQFREKYPEHAAYATQVFSFLRTHHAVVDTRQEDEQPVFETWLSTPRDIRATETIVAWLRALGGSVQCRNLTNQVPCKPAHQLTEEQRAAATHMYTHPLTLLESPPGAGKTELIVWAFMQFSRCLIVSTTGMMVDSLSARLGKHPGCVHTIQYVITCYKMVPNAKAWLEQYDTLIIDECSNVDTHRMARLLQSVPGVRRIILVGDGGQINPIDPGCPFRNLIEVYPQHTFRLTRCLRVQADSRALAEAASHIRANHAERIPFRPNAGPIQLWDRPPGTTGAKYGETGAAGRNQAVQHQMEAFIAQRVNTLYPSKRSLMTTQWVAMQHVDRKNLNVAIENAVVKVGLITRPRAPMQLYGCAAGRPLNLFPGQKLTFTQNCTIKPNDAYHGTYDSVRNGELVQIASVRRVGGAFIIKTVRGKTLRVSNTGPVPVRAVDAGWVITVNKSQGSEWDQCVFWIHENPGTYIWTREYPYVAISRAKRRSIVIGKRAELNGMCANSTRVRNTLLLHTLRNHPVAIAAPDPGQADAVPNFDFDACIVATTRSKKFTPQRPEPATPKKRKTNPRKGAKRKR